jgi:hypothetical protein
MIFFGQKYNFMKKKKLGSLSDNDAYRLREAIEKYHSE